MYCGVRPINANFIHYGDRHSCFNMETHDIMVEECLPENCNSYWKELCVVPETVNWEKIHLRNFKCTIDFRLRSFYFKVFHKAIAVQ